MRVLSKLVRFFWVAAPLACGPVVAAEPPPLSDPLRQIVETELAFAHKCSEIGIAKSFTEFFANDCVIFANGPTNGKKFYTKYNDHGAKLIWQPVFATVAASGDLGVTTGPWQLSKSGDDPKPTAFGQFVSVWKKQPDHSWKVVCDVGVNNPEPTEPPAEVQFFSPDTAKADPVATRRNLTTAEKSFAEMMREGGGSALVASASDNIRVLRDGAFPAVGKVAAKLMLSSEPGPAARTVNGGGVATSADLAYRYGRFNAERGNAKLAGLFLSVWRLEAGEWKIILDLQKKAENKK